MGLSTAAFPIPTMSRLLSEYKTGDPTSSLSWALEQVYTLRVRYAEEEQQEHEDEQAWEQLCDHLCAVLNAYDALILQFASELQPESALPPLSQLPAWEENYWTRLACLARHCKHAAKPAVEWSEVVAEACTYTVVASQE